MKQGVWSALLIASVVIALAIGFFGGQLWKGNSTGGATQAEVEDLAQQLSALAERVAALEESPSMPPDASGKFKIGYVDMFSILQTLNNEDNEVVIAYKKGFQELESEINKKKSELEQRFRNGEITRKELDKRLAELDEQLGVINLLLSSPLQQQILQVIKDFGEEQGYSIIIDNPASQMNAIVFYSQPNQADDITTEVLNRTKAIFEEIAPDLLKQLEQIREQIRAKFEEPQG